LQAYLFKKPLISLLTVLKILSVSALLAIVITKKSVPVSRQPTLANLFPEEDLKEGHFSQASLSKK